MVKNVAFLLPHFGHGGAEGVVLRLLQNLNRSLFKPILILQAKRGEFLATVPNDVTILALRRPRPPLCILELSAIYAREHVDIAVTLTNATNLYSVAAALLLRHEVATLITEHTPLSSYLGEAKLNRARLLAIRHIYPRATLIGGPLDAIGQDIEFILRKNSPPFVCLPNPVVETSARLRPLAHPARHIVSVGRLAPEKRFSLLVEAFALLRKERPDATLTIYGEGAERAALESQITQLGLEGVARLAGFTSDLDAVHAKADLFVCSSRREGLGNAIIEAMARGVPVVSVDCPLGPRSLLKGNTAGRLVARDTAEALAVAMHETMEDLVFRERTTRVALDQARAFEVSLSVRGYEAAFERAARTKRSRGQ